MQGDVVVTDLRLSLTSAFGRRGLLSDLIRKSVAISNNFTVQETEVTNTSTVTVSPSNFLLVVAATDLNVSLRQSAGTLQQGTIRGLFILHGSFHEVVISAPTVSPVAVTIISD